MLVAENCDLSAAVAVEYSEKCLVLIAIKFGIGYVRVFL